MTAAIFLTRTDSVNVSSYPCYQTIHLAIVAGVNRASLLRLLLIGPISGNIKATGSLQYNVFSDI